MSTLRPVRVGQAEGRAPLPNVPQVRRRAWTTTARSSATASATATPDTFCSSACTSRSGAGGPWRWAIACARADADGYRTFRDALFDYDAYGKRALTIAGERGGSMDDLAKVNGASSFFQALFAWTYATLKAAR